MRFLVFLFLVLAIITGSISYAAPPAGTFNFRHFKENPVYSKVYKAEKASTVRHRSDGHKYSNTTPKKWDGYGFYRPTIYTTSGKVWNGYGHP